MSDTTPPTRPTVAVAGRGSFRTGANIDDAENGRAGGVRSSLAAGDALAELESLTRLDRVAGLAISATLDILSESDFVGTVSFI